MKTIKAAEAELCKKIEVDMMEVIKSARMRHTHRVGKLNKKRKVSPAENFAI